MGVGFDPIGIIPAGYGTQVESPALALVGYQTSTTGAVSSVAIDATTRDYTFDDYGNAEGMSDAGQRVWCMLATLKDTRIDFPDGFTIPRKVAEDVDEIVEREVKRVLAPAIDDHTVELVDVLVEGDGTNVYAIIRWRDVSKSKITTNTLRLVG